MKVLFVTPYYYPNLKGGSERSVKLLAEGLSKKDVDVSVMSFDGESELHIEKIDGIKVIRIKRPALHPQTLFLNLSLLLHKSIIEEENPDIIHVYNTWQIPAASFFKKKYKIVATLNNYFAAIATSYTSDNIIEKKRIGFFDALKSIYRTQEGNPSKNALFSVFYAAYSRIVTHYSKKIDLYIPISKTTGKIHELQGFDGGKIFPVYNIFDKSTFPIFKKGKRKSNEVLYVGGLQEYKGVLDMINAFKFVKNKGLRLNVVGSGPCYDEMERITEENSLNVKFYGRLEHSEFMKLYATSAFSIIPSKWPDPFPRVLLESLWFEIPIIYADNPVFLEVFGKGETCFKRGDPKDLAEKIDLMAIGKIKSNHLQAKKRIFSHKPIEEIYALYMSLLSEK